MRKTEAPLLGKRKSGPSYRAADGLVTVD